MSNPGEPDVSSIYDADLSSEAEFIETAKNTPKNYIVRRKDYTCGKAGSICSGPSDEAVQAQLPPEVHPHAPSLENKNFKNPHRRGKVDWQPDISLSLFSATGQQYGLGNRQRGYLSGIFVTYLTYPEPDSHQDLESGKMDFWRRFKCWKR